MADTEHQLPAAALLQSPDFQLERRRVKHARIRIGHDERVQVVVPLWFRRTDVAELLGRHRAWIERKRAELAASRSAFALPEGQIWLLGAPWQHSLDPALDSRTTLDASAGRINTGVDLSDAAQRYGWYRRYAGEYFAGRLVVLGPRTGAMPRRLYLREQRSKWGNCSGLKNISLNWRLIMAPAFVGDYVLVHELAHLLVFNHSRAFWREVGRVLPDYSAAVQWLRQHGHVLLAAN